MLEKKIILGVGITDAVKQEILEYIIRGLEKDSKKYFIVTPNPEILTLANNDSSYKNILNKAKIALADGVGVIMAGKILGRSFKERTTGVDLLENLCKQVAEKPITVGFLGGKGGVAEKTVECLQKKYPGLKVTFIGREWSDKLLKLPKLLRLPIKVDILFVAFGAPKQEKWIYENLEKLPVRVAIGVGGAFDYISGNIPRAPVFIRKIGFEWLFRLIAQPWRIKRQLALLKFAFLVLKETIKK